MFSFKQLEAVYWIDRAGSFAGAALRLNTSQAAISKRVQELESVLSADIFDRSLRQARLTEKGEEVLQAAVRLLEQRDQALEALTRPEAMTRRLRIGVTELTAMTWLPLLLQRVRAEYPRVAILPDVDSGLNLRDKLLADEIDVAIAPQALDEPRFSTLSLGQVPFAWMCQAGALPADRKVAAHELAGQTILVQGPKSVLGTLVERWLRSQQVHRAQSISTDSVLPLIGLTVAGMGVSYLPRDCLATWIDSGALQVFHTSLPAPEVHYAVSWRAERRSVLVSSVTQIARECCDFSSLFQRSAQVPAAGRA